jgi:hypothetical protein
MEGLRIRIPQIFPCVEDGCLQYNKKPEKRCRGCLLARVRKEMAAATLTSQAEVIHGSSFGRNPGGSC